jgi:hypothetical protein
MAVANITEYSNAITYPKVLSDLMAPAFVKSTFMLNHVHVEDLPTLSQVVQFQKEGSLTGASLAESTALAINSNGELTRASVDATVAKAAVSSGLSVEALRFSNIDLGTIATRQAEAIARYVDNQILALFSGLSTTVTSAAGMTIDDIMLGQYNVYNSECPNKEVPLTCVLGWKGLYNIKKELIQSGASVWTNPGFLTVLQGTPQANGLQGSLPGINVFATSGLASGGGDNYQAIFHPMWTFAGVFDAAPHLVTLMRPSEGLYQEAVSYYFWACVEWNDLGGVFLKSDT